MEICNVTSSLRLRDRKADALIPSEHRPAAEVLLVLIAKMDHRWQSDPHPTNYAPAVITEMTDVVIAVRRLPGDSARGTARELVNEDEGMERIVVLRGLAVGPLGGPLTAHSCRKNPLGRQFLD